MAATPAQPKRILIDLTDLEQWGGTYGGIQRVVYGIAKCFFLDAEAVRGIRFISFDAERRAFYYTSFEPIYERVHNGIQKVAATEPEAEPVVDISAFQRTKDYLKRRVPARLKQQKLVRQAVSEARKARAALQLAGTPEAVLPDDRQWVVFGKSDVVLLLGMPWSNPHIMETLSSLRRQRHFTLGQVVYDLIICLYPHLHHPANFEPYVSHMKAAIANSDLLLPISQSSARDLKTFAKQNKLSLPRLQVIRLGDEVVVKNEGAKPDDRIGKHFIACIGTIEVRKNHALLYYAYKLAEERGISLPQLVIVGSSGWFSGDVQYLFNTDPVLKNKVIMLHGVSDADLTWVYQHCLFTVYPSMYEGWGLPIAESLAYGKLCVAANTSSMPEIAGDLIDYFSPYDAEACMEKMAFYQVDANRLPKEKKIVSDYRQTSWEQTYKQVKGTLGIGQETV